MTSHKREEWGSWLQFFFSAVGTLVGLGNIWRFPYVCYRNGGGAFLLPFCLFMVVLGIPIGFLEMLYCQYSNMGPGKVWVICPLFKGIWMAMMVMTFVISMYYTMLMAWILYYFCVSFSAQLPWTSCDNDWNTPNCVQLDNYTQSKSLLFDGSDDNVTLVSSQEEYWVNEVLSMSDGIDKPGNFQWRLVLCLLVAWLLVFLCLSKGVQVMGKIAFVAATLPFVVLTILLLRGVFLEGAGEGIIYFFKPDWEKLADYSVWRDAATQLFFSAGLGFGCISTLSSYNKFHNNCFRDAILMPILDVATSIFAGIIIFAYMGYMANLTGKDVGTVVKEGPGLVFVAYPTALQTIPLPQLWSVLFFAMLFCTGLDSQFSHIQTLATAIVDIMPRFLPYKTRVIAFLCVVSFIAALPLTTQGGIYILNLLDWYIASICIMLIVMLEIVVLAWIYGTDRLYDDIHCMIGFRVSKIFAVCWRYITPIIMLVLWLSGIVAFQPIGSKNPGYFWWSDAIGIFIAFLPILPIPILAVHTLCGLQGSLWERIKESLRPTSEWKSALSRYSVDVEENGHTTEFK